MVSRRPSSHHWYIPPGLPVNSDVRFDVACRNILAQLKVALGDAEKTRREFLERTYPELQVSRCGEIRQTWLPAVPVRPYLRQAPLNAFLLHSFHLFQHFSVVFEQMILDQRRVHGPFLCNYDQLDHDLFRLIFELFRAMKVLRVPNIQNVDRSVLPKDLRKVSGYYKTVRDYLTLRDLTFTLVSMVDQFESLCE